MHAPNITPDPETGAESWSDDQLARAIFPVKYLIRNAPAPLDAPVQEPDLSTSEKRGQYLVTIAGCSDCHTPKVAQGQPLPDLPFGGGFVLDGPWGRVASANLTPDPSGIPNYDQVLFTEVLRRGT